MLGNSTVSLFRGFAFAFDLAAITFTLDCEACFHVDLQEVLYCCDLNRSHICLFHKIF